MKIEPEYLALYIISNIVALVMLLLAWKKPNISRLLYILLFAWASVTNATAAIKTPEVYLDYAQFTFLPFYKNIINGAFSEHITSFVLMIAACQLIIAILLFAKGKALNLSLTMGILFFIGIAPFGVGAAFPSSLIWALGLIVLYKKNLNHFRLNQIVKSS